jgi:hypothetical protein
MRLRLLRRRLTISAPRMAVRSAVAWPVRWLLAAIVLGFCAAVALWAFELGKSLAGLDTNAKEELASLRAEVVRLRDERDKAQSVANTSGSLMTAEKVAQERLAAQLRQLEAENRTLRDDLGFFEKLIPASGSEAIAIRGLQAEVLGDPQARAQIRWQVLVIQPVKNAPEFKGQLELTFAGIQGGKPWTMALPGGPQTLQVRQYRRLEGVFELPPQTVVKNVSAKVVDGATTRAMQTVKLSP